MHELFYLAIIWMAVFSEISIIVNTFALGFEENPGNFIASVKRSWGCSAERSWRLWSAYAQNAILSQHAFYTLMVTAFMLNIAVPLSIRRWKRIYVNSPAQAS